MFYMYTLAIMFVCELPHKLLILLNSSIISWFINLLFSKCGELSEENRQYLQMERASGRKRGKKKATTRK